MHLQAIHGHDNGMVRALSLAENRSSSWPAQGVSAEIVSTTTAELSKTMKGRARECVAISAQKRQDIDRLLELLVSRHRSEVVAKVRGDAPL